MAKQSTKLQPSGQAMLYNFLLNEVLASQLGDHHTFWIIAPWVTNFYLEHPYYVSFQEIVETRQDSLHLFDILHQMGANGIDIKIVVGEDTRYYSPLRQLQQQNQRIKVRKLANLHTKLYVGRCGAIDGSLNMTNGGLNKNIELFTYYHDERHRCELQHKAKAYFEQGESL